MSGPAEAPIYADLQQHDGGLWQTGSITFLVYMMIGFSATMGLIVAIVGIYMLIRRDVHSFFSLKKPDHRAHATGRLCCLTIFAT